jgi:cell division ATPase FtsA
MKTKIIFGIVFLLVFASSVSASTLMKYTADRDFYYYADEFESMRYTYGQVALYLDAKAFNLANSYIQVQPNMNYPIQATYSIVRKAEGGESKDVEIIVINQQGTIYGKTYIFNPKNATAVGNFSREGMPSGPPWGKDILGKAIWKSGNGWVYADGSEAYEPYKFTRPQTKPVGKDIDGMEIYEMGGTYVYYDGSIVQTPYIVKYAVEEQNKEKQDESKENKETENNKEEVQIQQQKEEAANQQDATQQKQPKENLVAKIINWFRNLFWK